MNREDILEKIEDLINNANSLKEGYNRDLFIGKIKSYITFLLYTNNINGVEFYVFLNKINSNKRDNKINQFDEVRINNLIKNNNLLMKYYDEVINIYDKYDLDYVDDYCHYSNISLGMISFLKYVNIYDLFKKILENKMIGKSYYHGEYNLTINNYDDSYIVIGNFSKDSLFYYTFFVHEMGHVLVNNVLKEKRLYSPTILFGEVIPILLERMFIIYLENNKFISDEEITRLKINIEANRSFEMIWTYETCDIIKNKNYILDNVNVITVPDINSKYHTLDNHYYAIANIVSISLLDEYKSNPNLFIRNLPNLILKLSTMTLKDLINNYYDINLINNYLKNNLDKSVQKIKS